jgi:hypothetical protein
MDRRRRIISYTYSIAGILFCALLLVLQAPVLAQEPFSTPTSASDPLAQPELPPNPSELEMGRYLFWRHCMPCHGDVGQGLTDEFRILWEEHQDCWESGCHGGKSGDEGFPIPTVIPAIVREDHLRQFASEQELFEYLKATHPPQYPGHLENEEYHAITSLIFTMNERSEEEATSAPLFSLAPTLTFLPSVPSTHVPLSQASSRLTAPVILAGLGVIILAAISIRMVQSRTRGR